MITVSIREARTQLSRLLKKIEAGEEVVITRNRKPIARIIQERLPDKKPLLGAFKGQFLVDDRFFEPLPEDEMNAWFGVAN